MEVKHEVYLTITPPRKLAFHTKGDTIMQTEIQPSQGFQEVIMADDGQSIGARVRYLREKTRHLTRSELSRLTGLSPQSIYNVEVGLRLPKPGTIAKLAAALECSEDYLVVGFDREANDMPLDVLIANVAGISPENARQVVRFINALAAEEKLGEMETANRRAG